MSVRVEYVDPQMVSFVNELDLAGEVWIESAKDEDVLVIAYDEVVVIPGGRAGAEGLVRLIQQALSRDTDPTTNRARRYTPEA